MCFCIEILLYFYPHHFAADSTASLTPQVAACAVGHMASIPALSNWLTFFAIPTIEVLMYLSSPIAREEHSSVGYTTDCHVGDPSSNIPQLNFS